VAAMSASPAEQVFTVAGSIAKELPEGTDSKHAHLARVFPTSKIQRFMATSRFP
jgi:hypothetical protein